MQSLLLSCKVIVSGIMFGIPVHLKFCKSIYIHSLYIYF